MKYKKLTLVYYVFVFLLGMSSNWIYNKYLIYYQQKNTKIERTGYTVINYDSVEWSDGKREKYNWHVHRRSLKY